MNILFDRGRSNRLAWARVCADDDHHQILGFWLSGRVFGFYINLLFPWRHRLENSRSL
jgi:hypothetical protein